MNTNTNLSTKNVYQRQLLHAISTDLKELSRLDWRKGASAILFDWSIIVLAITFSIWMSNPVVYLFTVAIIAARQHALLIIMHDASHYRLFSNKKVNTTISNLFLAYPMLIRTESYRHNHLAHHSHTNSDDDPDWVRKDGDSNWIFPKTRGELLFMLLRDLLGGGFWATLKAVYSLGAKKNKNDSKQGKAKFGLLAFWIVAATVFTITGVWIPVLLYWFLPAWTVLPCLLRIRSIAEHFGLANEHELNASRNFHCNWLEKTFFAPHNVGYHLDHHLFMSVPFYNLPEFHRRLIRQPVYAALSHQSDGIFGKRRTSVEQDVSLLSS